MNKLKANNSTFCVLPWIHIHNWPSGQAYPCCMTQMKYHVGDTSKQSLEEVWHSEEMKSIRRKMLVGEPVEGCVKCYEIEKHGPLSMRINQNQQFSHHIDSCTTDSPELNLVYWDIRFSNLCNLRCRSCGHPFSSNWYEDHATLFADDPAMWKATNKRVIFSGRNESDMIDQLMLHIDQVEQIYFAGGEPLIMQEHYEILNQLIKKNRTNVKLQYNTNFTEITYKKTNVLDLWNNFSSVSVGASLDAMGTRAEYIRKNSNWAQIEQNRLEMLKKCPQIDFYVSSTVSILNAWHISDFHKDWVDRGLIAAEDFGINVVQFPEHYRIDIFPESFKKTIAEKWQDHLVWLKPLDKKTRATLGYETALNFMMEKDNSHLLNKFWDMTNRLDNIRNENIFTVLPELAVLNEQ